MDLRLLGEVAVREAPGQAVLPITGARQRLLLALLLLHAPSPVSTDRILDELWTPSPAKSPTAALHTAVAKLRRALGPRGAALVRTSPGGYRADLREHRLDIRDFEAQLSTARAAPGPDRRAELLRAALDGFPGAPLAGLPALPFVQQERARLEAVRLGALEDWAEAELAGSGAADPAGLVEELRGAVRQEPGRERSYALLIRALQRAGRQPAALAAYREARDGLREQFGIEPGPELRATQRAVLRGVEARDAAAPGPAGPRGPGTPDGPGRPDAAASEPLIGRRAELGELEARLGLAGLVTVTGAGGVGKTRLAEAAVARERRSGATVWSVDLVPVAADGGPGTVAGAGRMPRAAGTVPGTVAGAGRMPRAADAADGLPPGAADGVSAAVAAAMGLPPGPTAAADLAERLRTLVARATRPLLVLDNCEHLLDSCAALAVQLLDRLPGLRILATSRERLALTAETTLALPPMTDEDAVELFRHRLARLSPAAARAETFQDIAKVCAAVDRLPLAIEIVAAEAASMRLPEILAQLQTHRGLLSPRLRSADPRHDTLRSAVDWSHRLLTDAERATLRALSVFSSPITTEAAEAVAGPRAAESLSRLTTKSLLLYEPDAHSARYRMLLPVRHFARAELAEHGEEAAALHRHTAWVTGLAERTAAAIRDGRAGEAFAAVAAAMPEVSACLDRLQDSEDEADRRGASRIATLLSLYWLASGRLEEGHRRLLRALPDTTAEDPWYAEALAWCAWLGMFVRKPGDDASRTAADDDRSLLTRALTAAEKTADPARLTLVGALAQTVHLRRDRLPDARAAAHRTATAPDERAHRWETGLWRLFHGELLTVDGQPAPGLESALTARELLTGLDPYAAATAATVTGAAYERLGHRSQAVTCWREARAELLALDIAYEAAYVSAILAYAAIGDGNWKEAAEETTTLRRYATTHDNPLLLATADTAAALTARAHGDHSRAEHLHRAAITGYLTAARPECAAHDLTMLAALAAESGRPLPARIRYEQALHTARDSGRPHAEILPLQGLIALADDRDEVAAHHTRLTHLLQTSAPHRTTECPFHLAGEALAFVRQ
ncbi:BTAD domain-containing putative transcriptional regulator [Streptomyces boninensis]|uniref:BTAD domain-containing putative transcriptional regulator n=1 Tax=Streptomyces boninensis TaxID=2039455 RepID=UPI003B20F3D3